jgi:AbrB family looped-hinge helix DNA binding protein
MPTVRLSTKGQVVIPKEIREDCHLEEGSELIVTRVGNEIRMRPAESRNARLVQQGRGLLSGASSSTPDDQFSEQKISEMLLSEDRATKSTE